MHMIAATEMNDYKNKLIETCLMNIVGHYFYGDFEPETYSERLTLKMLKDLKMYPENEIDYMRLTIKHKDYKIMKHYESLCESGIINA